MMQIKEGKKINTKVRTFFAQGHKSSNKQYYVDADGDPDLPLVFTAKQQSRTARRAENASASLTHRPEGNNLVTLVNAMLKMPVDHRSGNCQEMACLSVYYAIHEYHVKRACLYLGIVKDPGDHAFCIVAPEPISSESLRNFSAVEDFTKAKPAKSWLVIDPWLNVVCAASDYLKKGGAQLESWAGKGKRVVWRSGSVGPGWYAPNGEYQAVFKKAPLRVASV